MCYKCIAKDLGGVCCRMKHGKQCARPASHILIFTGSSKSLCCEVHAREALSQMGHWEGEYKLLSVEAIELM